MLRRSFAVRLLSAAGILALGLTAQAAEPFPGKSPIGAAKRAPPAQDMFQGKLKPVPELVMRDELGYVPIPMSDESYDELDARAAAFREGKERTFSGIWKLPKFYYGYKTHYGFTTSDTNIASFIKGVGRWRVVRPNSPTPIVIEAILLGNLAEKALQRETIDEVIGDEHFELYGKRMLEKRDFLLRHKAVGSQDPMWYAAVIDSSGAVCETLDHAWSMVEEGTTRFPDFHEISFRYLVTAGRCVDDLESLSAHLKKVVELGKARSGEPGEAMYTRLHWLLGNGVLGEAMYSMPGFDWNRMKAGMNDVLKQYNEPWNINNFAKFACEKGDIEKARELLPKALELPVVSVWGSSQNFQSCWTWANSEALLDARHGKKQ